MSATTTTTTGQLARAVTAVMDAVPYVQKRRAAGLNYSFAGEADLIESLHPAMVKHGLSLLPCGVTLHHNDTFTTAKGGVMRHVLAACRYKLLHASGEFEILETLGEANDSGDKAANKAMTAAYKYALRQAFNIETGDDPDRHASDPQTPAAKPNGNGTNGTVNHDADPVPHEAARPMTAAESAAELNKFRAALDKCKAAAEVKAAGLAVTPDLKDRLRPEDLQAMQDGYVQAIRRVNAAAPKP